jgi:glycosyltransferase involved in cell wall biosynthesis/predicted metal-dependent phosphoesterase TrpH
MTQASVTYRADLHVHSRCSDNPTHAGIRAMRGRESYAEPLEVYAAARSRGMDFVTISDHNTLNGSLAIAHLPGTFLSTEFDTWFPEDGTRVHVVALGLDERAFTEAEHARDSVQDLVACLREAGVLHYLAHPLFDMTGSLTADTVERMLLLFNVLEGRNGARVNRCNGLLREIVATLTPEKIADMAARQGIEAYGETPWRKSLVGGSDDHCSLFVAGAHTAASGDGTVQSFLAAVARGDCEPVGADGDARLLAHSIYTPAFWKLREMLRLDEPAPRQSALKLIRKGFGRVGRDVPLLDKTVRGVRSIAPGLYRDGDGRGPAWEALLEREIGSLLSSPDGIYAVDGRELNRRIFTVAQRLADDVINLHLQPLVDPSVHVGRKRWLQSAFAVGMVHFLQLPYFIAWSLQSRDRASQERLRRYFLSKGPSDPKIAVFTDTFDEVNGVSVSIRRLAETAAERGVVLEVITSTSAPTGRRDGAVNFHANAWRPLALSPDYPLVVPPVVDVLDYLEENEFTAIHVSTASGSGLVALLAAKLLHLPITGAFHTDLPRYAERLYPGTAVQKNTWRYVTWFYSMLDEVFAPSRATARDLVARGLDPRRVRVLPAWVDSELFSPSRRDDALPARYGANGGPLLVYAGRVAREKSVDLLAEAFRDVIDAGVSAHLMVAGDGPYRAEMEELLAGYPASFLGFVPQEELACVYASSDLFVFPSSTDTCGLVVLEAQAAGLPAIVSDCGGPSEFVQPGRTGLVIPGDDRAALTGAIRTLLDDEDRRRAMGRAAREHVLGIAGAPAVHGDTILGSLSGPSPAPGWRHSPRVRNAVSRRPMSGAPARRA